MIPEKLVEDFAPRLTFLDEFACRSQPTFFPCPIQSPGQKSWESFTTLNRNDDFFEEEYSSNFPSNRMSILALKSRCLAMCLYSNSIVLESKKKSFSIWNAWARSSEKSRWLRSAELVLIKKQCKALLHSVMRAWNSFNLHLKNLWSTWRMLGKKSTIIAFTDVFNAWCNQARFSRSHDSSLTTSSSQHTIVSSPNQELQISRHVNKYTKQARTKFNLVKSMSLKAILLYGALLARIIGTWAAFSKLQLHKIILHMKRRASSVLTLVLRLWTASFC